MELRILWGNCNGSQQKFVQSIRRERKCRWQTELRFAVRFIFWIFVNTTLRGFDWVLETMVHCRFDLRGPRVLQEIWLTNCGLVPLRVLVCQHHKVNGRGWNGRGCIPSFNCFTWDTKSRLASLAGPENWNERSTFSLEFCGGFVAVGTF